MPQWPATADPAAVEAELRQLLFKLLSSEGLAAYSSPDKLPAGEDFSQLGVASIDFLEFVLAVEEAFGVTILDTVNPNELPQTLTAWQQLVLARLAARS
ncbi:MAG: hypothetical protein K8T25_07325 [Planctomycetia bacterium]|nr:hypothetical protein [Planctomycetia bacterium]